MRRLRVRNNPHTSIFSRAFTLIELMFVIFVIALMAKILIPKVANLFRVNLKTSAVRISGYLQSAYEFSVLRHKRIRVQFDMAQGRYWAELANDEDPTTPLFNETTKLDDALAAMDKLAEEDLEEEGQESKDTFVKLEEEGMLKSASLPAGIKFKGLKISGAETENASWLEFNPTGFSKRAIIYIEHESGNTMSILLPAMGGRSLVERGETEFDAGGS